MCLPRMLSIEAFYTSSCSVSTVGDLRCWGDNGDGQLGVGPGVSMLTTPSAVVLTQVTQFSGGSNFACAIRTPGTVHCWGTNQYGAIGDGTNTWLDAPPSTPALSGVMSISVGSMHVCALTLSGDVRCWGDNTRGQLGIGSLAVTSLTSLGVPLL